MNRAQFEELLLQSLEHEQGGIAVYEAALGCAQNDDLKARWQNYLQQTRTHVTALQRVCAALGVDANAETPGRRVVRLVGKSLVAAMTEALNAGNLAAAELVACECVVLAETKDHADWQLLGKCAAELPGPAAAALQEAYDHVEDEEDEHLYHTRGWCRELWLKALGLTAVLPPPEEQQHVNTAMGAARAEQAGEKLRLDSNRETTNG